MEDSIEINSSGQQETQDRIETPDGNSVYLFRYDNPDVPNPHPNSETSKDELVGKWFTDSTDALRTYILMRPPNGKIVITQVPKSEIEKLRASNHESAREMDIEHDNFIIPNELLSKTVTIPFTVEGSGDNKYKLNDLEKIGSFIEDAISNLQAQPDDNLTQ